MKSLKTLFFSAIALNLSLTSFSQSPSPSVLSESMRVSLYQLSTGNVTNLADGNLTNYDDSYSNGLGDDAFKMNNFGENFGIVRLTSKLAIEQRKKIFATDTTFFAMWNMQQRAYRLIITTSNLAHPGLLGYFEDSYMGTSVPLSLNDINTIDFTVNSTPGSYASNRFRIVFKNPDLIALATNFVSFSGRHAGSNIELKWSVENESAMNQYTVERSTDRVNYTAIQNVQPYNTPGTKNYTINDPNFSKGDNFYRIKAVGLAGETQYSVIVKVTTSTSSEDILVYPNPVVNKKVNVSIPSQMSGKYIFDLISINGGVQPLGSAVVNSTQTIQVVQLPKTLAPGIYRLRIIMPDGTSAIKTINVL